MYGYYELRYEFHIFDIADITVYNNNKSRKFWAVAGFSNKAI